MFFTPSKPYESIDIQPIRVLSNPINAALYASGLNRFTKN